MGLKEIKVGERYKLELLCISTSHHIAFETPTGNKVAISKHDLECVSPAAPKYDPCRPFRKGDKVRPVGRYGRMPDDGAPVNVICEVVEDECKNGTVAIRAFGNYGSVRFRVTALYLELVTPVEELEPYIVRIVEAEGETEWHVEPRNNKLAFVAIYGDAHPYPKAAAEAERDRLNAEYRKEQCNG